MLAVLLLVRVLLVPISATYYLLALGQHNHSLLQPAFASKSAIVGFDILKQREHCIVSQHGAGLTTCNLMLVYSFDVVVIIPHNRIVARTLEHPSGYPRAPPQWLRLIQQLRVCLTP